MRLTPEQKKIGYYFDEVARLNSHSFEGVERAPLKTLDVVFHREDVDVFVSFRDLYGMVAFAIVTPVKDGRFIWAIAVEEGFRSKGIGSALLQEIARYYGNTELSLTCNINNWRAQRLYLALGYRITKVLHDFYCPDDGVEMRRQP